MAAGLGIEVAAEDGENEGQLAFLKQAGCQIVQGRCFGSPLPAEALAKLVRQVRAWERTASAIFLRGSSADAVRSYGLCTVTGGVLQASPGAVGTSRISNSRRARSARM